MGFPASCTIQMLDNKCKIYDTFTDKTIIIKYNILYDYCDYRIYDNTYIKLYKYRLTVKYNNTFFHRQYENNNLLFKKINDVFNII
jgi:hypothetical protein